MKWTQEKLEELYKKVNDRAAKDPAFYEKVVKDPKAAMEEVAGCDLPENFGIKYIEKDTNFGKTFIVPDFADGEIDLAEMKGAAGGTAENQMDCGAYHGQSAQKNNLAMALIIAVCAVAVEVGPGADACLAAFGIGEACVTQACGIQGCPANICVADACTANACAADACTFNACAADANIAKACTAEACGADLTHNFNCESQACGADVCSTALCTAEACASEVGGFEACPENVACQTEAISDFMGH